MKRNSDENVASKVKPYISKRLKKEAATQNALCESQIERSAHVVQNAVHQLPQSSHAPPLSCYKPPKQQKDSRQEHSNAVCNVRWNPKHPSNFVTASFDKQLIIWDCSYSKLIIKKKIVVHDEAVKDVTWSQDGTCLFSASFDKTSKLTNVETGVVINTFKHEDLVTSSIFHSTDGNILLTGTLKSGIFAWDKRLNKVIRSYKSFFGQIHDLLFLPDNQTFLSCAEVIKKNSMDKAIIAWDFKTSAALPYQIYQEPHTCTRLKLHPKKHHLLGQSSAGYIAIFDSSLPCRMNKYKRYEGHQCTGYRVGFDVSTDGRYIYSGSTDGHLFIYDSFTSNILRKIKLFSSPCIDVSCSPLHQSRVVCSSWDGQVTLLE